MQTAIILLAVVGYSFAAVGYEPVEGLTCHYKGINLDVGQQYTPRDECLQLYCGGKGGKAKALYYTSCPPKPILDEALSVQYEFVQQLGQPYPDCCPQLRRRNIENAISR